MLVCSLSNTKVQILEGSSGRRLKVKRILEMPLEEGIILNGQVLDEERLVELMTAFWKENKLPKRGISLVTNDSRFMTKMVELPVMSDKEIASYIPREFDDVEKHEPLYGFNHIGKGTKIVEEKEVKVENVLAVMVEREVFGNLIDLFKKAGIQVTNIASSMEGDVRLMNRLPQIAGKTCLVQLMDGSNLTNLLYVNGSYKYSNRTRLYSETDTPGYGVEVARSVSNIIQFAKAQQIEEPITDIFVGGISPESLTYMEEGVFQIDDSINVDWIDTGKGIKWPDGQMLFSDCISLVGGLLPVEGAGRLYYHWTHSGKRSMRAKGAIKSALPVIVVAIIMFGAWIYYGIGGRIYQSRIEAQQEYLASPLITENTEEYNRYANENSLLSAQLNYLDGVKRAKYTYPLGNSKVLKELYDTTRGYADVTITAFSAPEGMLTMSLSARNVDDINRLIGKLMQESIFGDVSYAGYTYNEESSAWTVNVTCTLAEAAGREEAEWN